MEGIAKVNLLWVKSKYPPPLMKLRANSFEKEISPLEAAATVKPVNVLVPVKPGPAIEIDPNVTGNVMPEPVTLNPTLAFYNY